MRQVILIFAVFFVLIGVGSTALTTFGKAPSDPQPETPTLTFEPRKLDAINFKKLGKISRKY